MKPKGQKPSPKRMTYKDMLRIFLTKLKPLLVLSLYFLYIGVTLIFCNITDRPQADESCTALRQVLCCDGYISSAIFILTIIIFIVNCACKEGIGNWFSFIWDVGSDLDLTSLTSRVATVIEHSHLQRRLKAAGVLGNLLCGDYEDDSSEDEDIDNEDSYYTTSRPSYMINSPRCKHRAIEYSNEAVTRFYGTYENSRPANARVVQLASPNESKSSYQSSRRNNFDVKHTTPANFLHKNLRAGCRPSSDTNSEISSTSSKHVSSSHSKNMALSSLEPPVNSIASDNSIRLADSDIPVVSATSGIPVIFSTRAPNSVPNPGLPIAYTLASRRKVASRYDDVPVVSANSGNPVDNPIPSSSADIPTVSARSGIPVVFALRSGVPVASAASTLNDGQTGCIPKLTRKPVGVVKPSTDRKRQQRRGNRQARPKQFMYVNCGCKHLGPQELNEMEQFRINVYKPQDSISEMRRRAQRLKNGWQHLPDEYRPFRNITLHDFGDISDSDSSSDVFSDEGEN